MQVDLRPSRYCREEPLAFVVAQGLPAFQQGFDVERAVGQGGQAPGQRPFVEQPVEDGGETLALVGAVACRAHCWA